MYIKKLEKIYFKIFPLWYEYLKNELLNCKKIIDIGCGPNSCIQYLNIPFSLGIDNFYPYIQESKEKNIHNEYIKADIRNIDFKSNSFDAVLCIDVLEHLTKEEGHKLINKMEIWARNRIIIYTPNGFIEQEEYDGNPQQKHKTGWSEDELTKLGFDLYGVEGWKALRGNRGEINFSPHIFWRIFSDITQKLIYRYPSMAFGLLAIKRLENENQRYKSNNYYI